MLDITYDEDVRRGRSPRPVNRESSSHVQFQHKVSPYVSSISRSRSRSPSSILTSPLGNGDTESELLPPNVSKPPISTNPTDDGHVIEPSKTSLVEDTADEEPAVAEPFDRVPSPAADAKRTHGAAYEKVGDRGVTYMHRFSLYETASRYYLVGADTLDRRYRILKIDRNADEGELSITEDDIVYDKVDMGKVLNAIDDGNRASGGLKLRGTTWGILGFIKFTGAYYMLSVIRRKQIAMIGGHYIYQVEETDLIPLTLNVPSRFKQDARNADEARFLGILNTLDLHRSFYYSYSYNITQTLQHNIMREREALATNASYPRNADYNTMFVWNQYLLQPVATRLKSIFDWCQPIIHGYIDQAGEELEYNTLCTHTNICSVVDIW